MFIIHKTLIYNVETEEKRLKIFFNCFKILNTERL